MIVKKIVFLVTIIFLICICGLWAGDTASFVDLGFSPDGRTYMFGQYGVQSPSLRPWADLYIVDVCNNDFVQNGRVSFTQNSAIKAGQDGSGVFYNLLAGNSGLVDRYNINFKNQGLPLYISRDENPPRNGETIDFRDFISGKAYKAELIPSVSGNEQTTISSFYIKLDVRSQNGQVRNYTIGNPQVKRNLITAYNIKRVLIDSCGESLIFVIEMKRIAENGFDIRYMVEAQKL